MEYLNIVLSSLINCFDWVTELDSRFGFLTLALSIFSIGLVWRFLISPLLAGSGSSDSVKKKKR